MGRVEASQEAGAGGADKGPYSHVNVRRASLATVEAGPVGFEGALFTQHPKIPLLLLPPACGHVRCLVLTADNLTSSQTPPPFPYLSVLMLLGAKSLLFCFFVVFFNLMAWFWVFLYLGGLSFYQLLTNCWNLECQQEGFVSATAHFFAIFVYNASVFHSLLSPVIVSFSPSSVCNQHLYFFCCLSSQMLTFFRYYFFLSIVSIFFTLFPHKYKFYLFPRFTINSFMSPTFCLPSGSFSPAYVFLSHTRSFTSLAITFLMPESCIHFLPRFYSMQLMCGEGQAGSNIQAQVRDTIIKGLMWSICGAVGRNYAKASALGLYVRPLLVRVNAPLDRKILMFYLLSTIT